MVIKSPGRGLPGIELPRGRDQDPGQTPAAWRVMRKSPAPVVDGPVPGPVNPNCQRGRHMVIKSPGNSGS